MHAKGEVFMLKIKASYPMHRFLTIADLLGCVRLVKTSTTAEHCPVCSNCVIRHCRSIIRAVGRKTSEHVAEIRHVKS